MPKPKTTIDKWSTKKNFEVVAPALFQERVIGETVATNPSTIPGRIIVSNLASVSGSSNPRENKISLRFKVTEVKGNRAITKFLGHSLSQDFKRSLVRRRTSKIYTNQNVSTKDNKSLKIKSFAVTSKQIRHSLKSDLRKKLQELVDKEASAKNFSEFINEAVHGRLANRLKAELQKIYPLRHVVVEKSEVLVTKSATVSEKPAS